MIRNYLYHYSICQGLIEKWPSLGTGTGTIFKVMGRPRLASPRLASHH